MLIILEVLYRGAIPPLNLNLFKCFFPVIPMKEVPTGWFKDAIIYQIFIDRFAGFNPRKTFVGTEFHGGTLKGIIGALDYLEDLGVNTLWISPFYSCRSYHGYDIMDFFTVDPRFGTLDDLKRLITAVHRRKMRIIADFVPNHVCLQHPFFLEAQRSKQSPYYSWFTFQDWPNTYDSFTGLSSLPKLNTDHPGVRKHLVGAARYWLSLGLDGFRMDHAIGPTHAFWRYFRKEITSEYPDIVLIGENWFDGRKAGNAEPTLGLNRDDKGEFVANCFDEVFHEYIGELDGVLDFEFHSRLHRCVVQQKVKPENFLKNLRKHYAYFPEHFYLVNFLDTHDMDRFLTQCGDDKEKLKLAATLQFQTHQPKVINYGTEIGMGKDQSITYTGDWTNDWFSRQPMRWDKKTWDKNLLAHYKRLIRAAKEARK